MNLLSQKLSALKAGTVIRLLQVNGQSIEGVVADNDGSEALSVRITAMTTLRYDQITAMEENLCMSAVQTIMPPMMQNALPQNGDNNIQTEKPDGIMKVVCDKEAVERAFKAMSKAEKQACNPTYSQCVSFFQSHDSMKCEEAALRIFQLMEENGWGYHPSVNLYYAYVLMLAQNIKEAAVSFFYANDIRSAYCAAYHAAAEQRDEELYCLAAAFAAIALTRKQYAHRAEAAAVLQEASLCAKDISGLWYVIDRAGDSDEDGLIRKMLCAVGQHCGKTVAVSQAAKECIAALQPYYPMVQVAEEIRFYAGTGTTEAEEETALSETSAPAEQPSSAVSASPDTTLVYQGRITEYNHFETKGKLVAEDGTEYAYQLSDVSDPSLRTKLKNMTRRKDLSIAVRFRLFKMGGSYMAVSLQTETENANALYTQKKYDEAVAAYRKKLSTPQWEEAFAQMILCYLAMWNARGDLGYSRELEALVAQYADRPVESEKTLESLLHYYTRVENHTKTLELLNRLTEQCPPAEYGRLLHYLVLKARCYRFLKDYSSAIGQMLDWLDIVNRNKLTQRYVHRDTMAYIELAELYFENGDCEKAEQYAKLSADSERRQALMKKLNARREKVEADAAAVTDAVFCEDEESEDMAEEQTLMQEEDTEENLQLAYDSYTDNTGFDGLGMDDAAVVENALAFSPEHLYCLLTYLKAAADLSADSAQVRMTPDGEAVHVGDALQSVHTAFGYAFGSPLLDRDYISTELLAAFTQTERLLPALNRKLFASAALQTLFRNPAVPDYHCDDLIAALEDAALTETFPALLPLAESLNDFRAKTGCGIDIFAGYKTNGNVLDSIIAEAKACCESVDMRNDVYEKHGRVRRMRELLFSGEESELRRCLDLVAANDTPQFAYVKERMAELFIRNHKPLEGDHADSKKIDKYIDRYWDMARDVLQNENVHISKPFEKLKGGRRTNVVSAVKRVITCICDWLAIAEHAGDRDSVYAAEQYETAAPRIIAQLAELERSCEDAIAAKGFDWGTESLRRTADVLRAKLNGTYDPRTVKYFFIDFLTGEEVLLNDKYLPELQSTFCDRQDFNILSRIARHAQRTPISLSDRVSRIFSEIETKHNFRSARLIRSYAEDMGITELAQHPDFARFSDCLKQAREHFEAVYHDFTEALEVYDSYGVISDINGEKSALQKLALEWYRITRFTNDFGFYAQLLEDIHSSIAANAEEQGRRLMHQLDELADKPEYDFGVYPKESIAALIRDRNYTAAEHMLNCIRRHDTKTVTDYTLEPFSYFGGFMNEHATNYRVAFDSKVNLELAVTRYVGKKSLEVAMKQLTNNAMKDVRGGCNLINNWIIRNPAGTERIEKLLGLLGFANCTVSPDDSNPEDSYQVFRKKQTGKVNYPHPIPAFSSLAEEEGFRVLCLYGRFDCSRLMDTFRTVNTVAKHTVVFLDFALNQDERRKLARKIKEEKSFAKSFIVVDRVILLYLAKHYASNTINRMLMAITMPFAYYQPFVEASNRTMPPELFTGREAELTSIEASDGANLVYGGRQLGKSALLKMAQHNIDGNANGDRAVLVEIKGRHYTEAARIVSGELIVAGILDEACRCDDWDVLAGHIKKRLMDDNPATRINYLLLMLDEADEFIRTGVEDDNRPISALKTLPSNRFKLVMAGLHNLSRYNRESVLHNNSTLIHLNSLIVRPFRRPEAVKLLTNTLAYLGFRFKEEVITLILAKTNYFPGLIQLYCQKLLEAMKNDDYAGYNEISTPSYEVTEKHVKKVLSDTQFTDKVNEKLEITLFVEEKGHSHYHILALVLSYLYYTAPSEKGYTMEELLEVAREYNITRLLALRSEQLEELLHEMWDLNVLTMEDNRYRFATEGFREMLGNKEKVEQSMSEYFGEGDAS